MPIWFHAFKKVDIFKYSNSIHHIKLNWKLYNLHKHCFENVYIDLEWIESVYSRLHYILSQYLIKKFVNYSLFIVSLWDSFDHRCRNVLTNARLIPTCYMYLLSQKYTVYTRVAWFDWILKTKITLLVTFSHNFINENIQN